MQAEDSSLNEAVARLQHLDFCQLGLEAKMGRSVRNGILEFERMAEFRSPFEKLKSLVACFRALTTVHPPSSAKKSASPPQDLAATTINTDQLIPLLLLVVLRSDVHNVNAQLQYTRQFAFHYDVESGELGYALSSLEAVVSYISSCGVDLIDASARTASFFRLIESDNVAGIRELTQRNFQLSVSSAEQLMRSSPAHTAETPSQTFCILDSLDAIDDTVIPEDSIKTSPVITLQGLHS